MQQEQSAIEAVVLWLNNVIWNPAFIWLCLGVGLFFSLMTRFAQVRHFTEMCRLLFRTDNSTEHGISSFQALSVSLSGRVGIGNIAGVAAAIGFGGPGAVFWMWVVAFLGASTAYVESTLGQIYKVHDKDAGMYLGGPAYYFERCLGWRWYGILFAVAATFACGLFLIGPQANGVASAMVQIFGEGQAVTTGIAGEVGSHRLIATACVLVLLSFIIFGGIRRIASFAQVIVPFMALAYIVLAMIIVFININRVPELLALIVGDAFNPAAGFGAAIGMGVKRGIYSNEAGQGTGAHAAAAAAVEHPVQQGLVQAFSVYIDTLFVCTATALIILMTKQYNIVADQHFAGEATQYIATYLKDASGAVINADPDLVVVSSSGKDSLQEDQLASLKEQFTVLVVDYNKQSWQDLATQLGAALGLEDKASAAATDFDTYLNEAKGKITPPSGGVTLVSYNGPSTEQGIGKKDSAHAVLMTSLGCEIVEADPSLDTGSHQQSGFMFVSYENLSAAITGESVFLIKAGEDGVSKFTGDETLANLPAVTSDQVYYLGETSFRIDFYSGKLVADAVVEQLGAS